MHCVGRQGLCLVQLYHAMLENGYAAQVNVYGMKLKDTKDTSFLQHLSILPMKLFYTALVCNP